MKQKTNRLHFSTRTLALVLSIVMLIGSIATGSMLNTFAAYLKDAAANSDAVSQAATEGGAIALNAIPSDDVDTTPDNEAVDTAEGDIDNTEVQPDLSGFEESPIVRRMKQDLADTGARVDLAGVGVETLKDFYFGDTAPSIVFFKNTGTINGTAPGDNGTTVVLTKSETDEYYGGWYFKTNTSGDAWNYPYKISASSNWLSFGTGFDPTLGNSDSKAWRWKKDGDNDAINIPATASGYVHGQFDTKGKYSDAGDGNTNGYQKWYVTAVPVLANGSLSAASTSIYEGQTTTLSTTNPTGGTGSYAKSAYSVTRQSGDPSATASISGSTFYAPNSVSTATVFRVSCTFTDNNCPGLTITVTRDITVNPKPTATISEAGGSATTRSAAPTINNSTTPGGSSSYSSVEGTTVYVHTYQNEGYKAIVSVSDVDVTRDSSNLFHFTMPATSKSVSVSYAALATDLSITAHSNDSSLGTVTVGKVSANEDETVTVTLANVANDALYKTGTFTVTYNDGTSSHNVSYTGTPASNATITFTMPHYPVTVYAEYEEYEGDANFWYDGYQRKAGSGTDAGKLVSADGQSNIQFTESAYNGNKFAYAEITRTDEDPKDSPKYQEFTVKSSLDATGSSTSNTGKYIFFEFPNSGDYTNKASYCRFYTEETGSTILDSSSSNGWKKMDWVTAYDNNSRRLYRYVVPNGVKRVQFKSEVNESTSITAISTAAQLNTGSLKIVNTTQVGGYIPLSENTRTASEIKNKYDGTASSTPSETGSVWYFSSGTDNPGSNKTYSYITTGSQAKYGNNIGLSTFNDGTNDYAMHTQIVSPESYYVIILYPSIDYDELYPEQGDVGSDNGYRVYVTKKLPGTPNLEVNYFAKDGVVRMWSKSTGVFGTTTVTETDYVTAGTRKNFNEDTNCSSGSGAYNGWQKDETWLEGTCTKGQNITVTTTLDDSVKDKYYIKGFSFNGLTPQIFEWNSDGIYTCTYSIPENFQGNELEITPIYFLKDDSNCINFYIDGYNDTVKSAWGNELYVYPFYQYYKNGQSGTVTDLAGQAENYRAYPGQPVINYGGRRYMQIPLTDDGTAGGYRIKGVTINNGYWDQVHGDTKGSGDGHDNKDTMGADFVNVHRQTYDYDDFYKIYNEYGKGASKTLNNIYFTFKYRADGEHHRGTYADSPGTKTDQNSDNAAALTSANASTHTWEPLKNNFNKPVDLFGNELTDAALTTYSGSEMYVISEGYEANNAGKFATEWAIYKKSGETYTKVTETGGKNKTSIVPSVLVISEASRINATQYPALDGDLATTDYKGIYQALEEYTGVPVKICYEKELHGGSKSGGYDPAYRSDGRWTFTKTTDYVKANVKIEYINEKNGVTEYTEDSFTENSNVGRTTGAKAYFTYNAAESGYGAQYEGATSLSGLHIQDNKYFNFAAETAGSYEFMGWYSVDTNGDYHAVNNDDIKKVTGHSAMSSDSTFVARFKYVSNGSLSISHSLVAGDTGLGTTYLGVYVNGVQIADEATNTNSVRLDKTYIGSNKTSNTITIKLRTVPIGDTTFTAFTAKKVDPNEEATTITSGQTYFDGENTTTSGVTTRVINFTVGDLYTSAVQQYLALNYYSDLTPATNSYLITYNFKDRSGANKTYSVKGTFTPGEMKSYFDGTGTSKTMKADATQFFTDHAPHESNFMKSLTWDLASTSSIVEPTWTGSDSNYLFTASVNSTQNDRDSITGVFDVPYEVMHLDAPKDFTPKAEEGIVAMLDEDSHVTFEVSTTYGKWFENIPANGSYSNNDRSSQLITAARTIHDTKNDKPMYFSYWQISSLTKYGTAGKDIARAYHPRFNYVGYENYYIKAIYTDDPEKAYDKLVDSEDQIKTSISFIEDSRNQWNDKNVGASDSEVVARDIIYNDFALSFHYGDKLLTDCVGSGYGDIRLGMVIQKLGEVDKNSGTHIGTLDSYEAKYQSSVKGTHDKLVTALASEKNDGSSAWGNGAWANIKYDPSDATKKYASYNHVIAANNESTALGTSTFNTDLIDNKNRTEYYFSLDNSQGQKVDLTAKNTYSNKDYVYRAFSYIMVKENGAWTVRVSDKPAYFCMYDRATLTK